MQVHTSTIGDATVLTCDGRLTMVAAPTLRSAIDDAVSGGHVRLVVDLAGTSFVDSSGLGALVAGLKRTRQAGGDLRIASRAGAGADGAQPDQPRPHPAALRHRG